MSTKAGIVPEIGARKGIAASLLRPESLGDRSTQPGTFAIVLDGFGVCPIGSWLTVPVEGASIAQGISRITVALLLRLVRDRPPDASKTLPQSPTMMDQKDFFAEATESQRYKITEVIGKGSYGIVASAVDQFTGEAWSADWEIEWTRLGESRCLCLPGSKGSWVLTYGVWPVGMPRRKGGDQEDYKRV